MADTITLSELGTPSTGLLPEGPAASGPDPVAPLRDEQISRMLPAWALFLSLTLPGLGGLLLPHVPGWKLAPWLASVGLTAALLLLLHHWQQRGVEAVCRHWPLLFGALHAVLSLCLGLGALLLLPGTPPHLAISYTAAVLLFNALAMVVTTTLFPIWLLGAIASIPPLALSLWRMEGMADGVLLPAGMAVLLLSLGLLSRRFHSLQRELLEELVSAERMRELLGERQELQQGELRRMRLYRRRSEHARRELERRSGQLETILQTIDEAVLQLDHRGRILYANSLARAMTGKDGDQLLQQPLQQVLNLQDEAQGLPLPDPVAICLQEKGTVHGPDDAVLRLEEQRAIPVEYHLSPRIGEDGRVRCMVLTLRDVTDRRRESRRLNWHASHDPLTGLINRREFERRLGKLVRHAELHGTIHALCYLDLDHFKQVNDRSGHEAGDELLKSLTRTLQLRIRATDTFARLGGDEFGILFYNCTPEKARQLAEGLRRIIEQFDFSWQGRSHRVGASIGLTLIDRRRRSMAELMREADRACYLAKHSGRNRVHLFQPGDEVPRPGETEPPVDEGSLLLRRFTPLRPGEEHAVCEVQPTLTPDHRHKGLRSQTDRWVFRATLEALQRGHGKLRDGDYVAIPIGAESVCDPAFLRFVTETLERSGVDPRLICFELDHSQLINHLARARSFIITLKARGCRFILGGYRPHPDGIGSLDLLPVDFLKLAPLEEEPEMDPEEHYRLIRDLSRQGHCHGILTIADEEGDPHLRDALRRLGIDYSLEQEAAFP